MTDTDRARRGGATEAVYGPVAPSRRLCYARSIRLLLPDMTKPASPSFADERDTGFRRRHGDKSIIANCSLPVKGMACHGAAISLTVGYCALIVGVAHTEELSV